VRRTIETLTRRNWIWVVVTTALLAALVGALVGIATGVGSQHTIVEQFFPNHSELAKPSAEDIQAVLAKVEPAVVSIDTTVVQTGSSGNFVEGAGSGMILTPDGEVLTNNHVVAGATSVQVTLFGQTKQYGARVIGTDPSRDLALVQIEGVSNLPSVTLGQSSAVRVGDGVIAIGNALALQGGPTVTDGIVSATGRSLSAQSDFSNTTENLSGLIQTDAPINPGNSGGPLVDSHGKVIGMNTAVAQSSAGNAPAENIGFAIAIDSIKLRLDDLRHGGPGGAGAASTAKSAYMGVIIESVTPQLKQQKSLTQTSGAYVAGLDPNGPAQHAGIKKGDVIVSIGGHPVTSATGLVSVLHQHKPGDRVSVDLYRGANKMTVSVTLGSGP
jgi:S1-C subfamily serine protease